MQTARLHSLGESMNERNRVCEMFGKEEIPYAEQEPLKRHTSFQIGGPAQVFCTPQSPRQLAKALELCRTHGVRSYLLGKGSNILFGDDGFDGVIIHVGAAISSISVDGTRVTAQAGAALADVCKAAQGAGLSGLEFAFGIPGCIGGAVHMNAGAYGGEMKDVLESVTFFDETGELRTLPVQELALGYRTSVFEQKPWCVVSAVFALQAGDAKEIQTRMTDFARRRAEKQPLEMPSAGSTFKRPEGAFAGALIDQCGLRGFSVGGAAISTKHCGFVVNTRDATCADVIELTRRVCEIVQRETGFVMEKEVRVVE